MVTVTECHGPKDADMMVIVISYCMVLIATLCLLLTIYGIYKYVKFYKQSMRTDTMHTPKKLFIAGFVFFIISSITLLNVLFYDIFYLLCTNLIIYEGINIYNMFSLNFLIFTDHF